jgi:acyl-CoA thioesterase-1
MKTETPSSVSIVCLGDSITNGFGVRRPWRLVMQHLLRERYPEISFKMLNAGVDGDTLSGGRRRLRRDVLRYTPDLITIAFGLNDLYMGVPLPEFRQNLNEMVEKIKHINCRPILLTTIQPAVSVQLLGGETPEFYNEIIRKMAKQQQIPVLDVWEFWPALDDPWSYFLSDGVHPNEDGHVFLGKLTAGFLASLIVEE